jgi:hypothetical protein
VTSGEEIKRWKVSIVAVLCMSCCFTTYWD